MMVTLGDGLSLGAAVIDRVGSPMGVAQPGALQDEQVSRAASRCFCMAFRSGNRNDNLMRGHQPCWRA